MVDLTTHLKYTLEKKRKMIHNESKRKNNSYLFHIH